MIVVRCLSCEWVLPELEPNFARSEMFLWRRAQDHGAAYEHDIQIGYEDVGQVHS